MYERFTDHARNVMQLANRVAQRFNHEYIGTEHILLGLVADASGDGFPWPAASQTSAGCGALGRLLSRLIGPPKKRTSESVDYPSFSAAEILKNLNVDLAAIRLDVENIVESGPNPVTGKLPQSATRRKSHRIRHGGGAQSQP